MFCKVKEVEVVYTFRRSFAADSEGTIVTGTIAGPDRQAIAKCAVIGRIYSKASAFEIF